MSGRASKCEVRGNAVAAGALQTECRRRRPPRCPAALKYDGHGRATRTADAGQALVAPEAAERLLRHTLAPRPHAAARPRALRPAGGGAPRAARAGVILTCQDLKWRMWSTWRRLVRALRGAASSAAAAPGRTREIIGFRRAPPRGALRPCAAPCAHSLPHPLGCSGAGAICLHHHTPLPRGPRVRAAGGGRGVGRWSGEGARRHRGRRIITHRAEPAALPRECWRSRGMAGAARWCPAGTAPAPAQARGWWARSGSVPPRACLRAPAARRRRLPRQNRAVSGSRHGAAARRGRAPGGCARAVRARSCR